MPVGSPGVKNAPSWQVMLVMGEAEYLCGQGFTGNLCTSLSVLLST